MTDGAVGCAPARDRTGEACRWAARRRGVPAPVRRCSRTARSSRPRPPVGPCPCPLDLVCAHRPEMSVRLVIVVIAHQSELCPELLRDFVTA